MSGAVKLHRQPGQQKRGDGREDYDLVFCQPDHVSNVTASARRGKQRAGDSSKPTNPCQTFSKEWLVAIQWIGEVLTETGAHCATTKTENKTMKKMILLAAMLGLATALTTRAADAKENWEANCAKCHGADGKGDTKMGQKLGCKDMTDAKVQGEIKDDAAFKAIKEGLKSADDKTLMKPFEALSDDEIKALVAYVRTLKK